MSCLAHLQGRFKPSERLLPCGLRCPSRAQCAAPWAGRGRGLFRRRGPARAQGVAQKARIKEQLQHALLCHCPVQGAAKLQSLPAGSQQGYAQPVGAIPKYWDQSTMPAAGQGMIRKLRIREQLVSLLPVKSLSVVHTKLQSLL